MASRVWITEFATSRAEALPYATLASAIGGQVLDLATKPSVVSEPFPKNTGYIRVVCEAQCVIALVQSEGRPEDATLALNTVMTAGRTEIFGVPGGASLSVVLAP